MFRMESLHIEVMCLAMLLCPDIVWFGILLKFAVGSNPGHDTLVIMNGTSCSLLHDQELQGGASRLM